ncbi:MAG: hypothetical protein LBD59_02685 [Prevotellaceae bacterium]|jgi:hypothetical protein|nr:hypothetical protein [Prevotellaceae bacterium]
MKHLRFMTQTGKYNREADGKNLPRKLFSFVLMGVIILCGIVAVQSCSNTEELSDNSDVNQTVNIEYNDWEGQLTQVMNAPPSILKKSGIKLLSYEIDNSINKSNYKEFLKKNENMYPIYSDDFKTLRAVSKKETIHFKSEFQQFTFDGMDEYLESFNWENVKILNLKWDNNGIETHTVCAVSDEEGIIYDNFISNVFLIKDPVITTELGSTTVSPPRLKTITETFSGGCWTWTLEEVTTWLWGSNRGKITITHVGCYANSIFLYHYYNTSHGFQMGSSAAQATIVGDRSIAYGWALATPNVTISITFQTPNFTLSFGGSGGTKIGGTGQHTFPPSI